MACRAVPHAESVLRAGRAETEDDARRLCADLLPGWAALPAADVVVSVISGGITNSLLKVVPPAPLQPVVVRVFGDNTEMLINRTREIKVLLELNAAGFGAQVLATFSNGRVEAWMDARPLAPEELASPTLSPRIARLLHAFHRVRVQEEATPQLWALVRSWLESACSLRLSDPERQARLEAVDLDQLAADVDQVQAACEATRSPVVYCHNDLLAPNILWAREHEEDSELHLIDFEYGCYNARGFDLGNHFNEWAGFECDYSRYPSDQQQRTFLAAYLEAAQEGARCASPSQEALDALVVEANVYALASHLYWAVWALLQAKYSAIDFDYLGYHSLRMAEARRRMPQVLPTVKPR